MIFDEIFENKNSDFSVDFQQVIRGEDGYTPVKGVDYWTEADKAEMVADVMDELSEQDIDSAGFNTHIADKQNPHKVTARQIGAAPMSELGDVKELYSVMHLADNMDQGMYIDANYNFLEQENCTIYTIPMFEDADFEEHRKLQGKTLRIKTYAYGDMSYGLGGASGATNANADIEEDPRSGIWEFEVAIPEDFIGLFRVSFCTNNYLDAPEIAISQGTVWEEIKALQEFKDNAVNEVIAALPIYNGEVLE